MTHGERKDPAAARAELRALDEADRMWAALEGDLSPEERARFEARIAEDAALRRRVREGRSLGRVLALYGTPEPAPDFAARTLARLEAEGLVQRRWYARRVSLPLPLAAALLAAAGLFLAWFLLRGERAPRIEERPLADAAERAPAIPLAVEFGEGESREHADAAARPARRSFGPRIVIGAAGSAAAFFDLDAEDELFPLEEAEAPARSGAGTPAAAPPRDGESPR
jgi:anti-sigma factor RsiW